MPAMLLRSLLLWAAWASVCAAGSAPRLLLAVGDVSRTHARVLVDALQPPSATLLLRVLRFNEPADGDPALDRDVALDLTGDERGRPRAVQLDGLQPSTSYAVELRWEDSEADGATDKLDRVWFRTASGISREGTKEGTLRVLVVSCDRFVDDGDDALTLTLAQDVEQSPTHFGVAHIGDQIYADAGSARVPVSPLPLHAASDATVVAEHYRQLVDAFRGIYRVTWGRPAMQRVLRRGAHWMLPDDHEVANNLNRERVTRSFSGWTDTSLSTEERALLLERTLHYRAGLQVFYEFQYQLQRDVPWTTVDFLRQPLDEVVRALPLHFAVQVGQLGLFFLDVRFDRAFLDEASDERLIGAVQRDALASSLQNWSQERKRDVIPVVLCNLPLFFHSSLSAGIAHLVEQETYPGHLGQRDGLQDLFDLLVGQQDASNPPPVVRLLVGGDVHMAAHSRVCDASGARCVDQLVTSGLTSGSTAVEDAKLVPFYVLITRLTPAVDFLLNCLASITPQRLIAQLDAVAHRSPWRVSFDWVFLGRNYGVLEVSKGGEFHWQRTVITPHAGARRHLVQALFDASSTAWVLALVLLLVTLSSAVVALRVTRWVFTSKAKEVDGGRRAADD